MDSSSGNKTVISPFYSNKQIPIIVYNARLITVYNDTKKTKKLWIYYYFFSIFLGVLVEFTFQTYREGKFESKMQKIKKTQFFNIWTY